jgi:hypothetical protein
MKYGYSRVLFFTFYTLYYISLQASAYSITDCVLDKGYSSTHDILSVNEPLAQHLGEKAPTKAFKTAGFVSLICIFYVVVAKYFVYLLNGDLNKINNTIGVLENREVVLNNQSLGIIEKINSIEDYAKRNTNEVQTFKEKYLKFGAFNNQLNEKIQKEDKPLVKQKDTCIEKMKQEFKNITDKYEALIRLKDSMEKNNKEIDATRAVLDKSVVNMEIELGRMLYSQQGFINQIKRYFSRLFLGRDPGKPRLEKFKKDLDIFKDEYTKFRDKYQQALPSFPTSPSSTASSS